jgi:dienelactone hydrolase
MNPHRYFPVIFSLVFLGACAQPQQQGEAAEATVRDLRGDTFTYDVDGQKYTGYIAYDANSSGVPGVLVVHQWWGHSDYVRMRADLLAQMGYTALALDMYGEGKVADHPETAQKFAQEVFSDMDGAARRFNAALEILKNHPTTDSTKTAAIGYCFGGAVVLEMARRGLDLDAVTSFHGTLDTPTKAGPGDIKARILVLNGADDPFVPQESIDAFKKEMAAAGADMRFVSYPGTVHAFTDPDATEKGQKFNLPLRYSPTADRESWAEFSAFMAETFGEPQGGD